jgi:hypothetical protein
MTRQQIMDGLLLFIERLDSTMDLPAETADGRPWRVEEWAYVKGIVAGEVMRLRDRLLAAGKLEDLK